MNKEEIVEGLKRCILLGNDCSNCPFAHKNNESEICQVELYKNIIALLDDQNVKIKEYELYIQHQKDGYAELEAEYNKLLKEQDKPDCEHANHDGAGCLGYSSSWQDDEPIDACKECKEYTGNKYTTEE